MNRSGIVIRRQTQAIMSKIEQSLTLVYTIHQPYETRIIDMPESHDPRYLEGIELFNRGEYFEAHEVWEDLWQDCPSCDRRFYQALIQAAVAIYHFERGNFSGTARLARSGKRYMEPYRLRNQGLEVESFWKQVEGYIAGALGGVADALQRPRPIIVLESPSPKPSPPTPHSLGERGSKSEPPLPQGEGVGG